MNQALKEASNPEEMLQVKAKIGRRCLSLNISGAVVMKQSFNFIPSIFRPLYVTVVYQGKCSHCMRVGVAVPLSGTVSRLRQAVAQETKIPAQQVLPPVKLPFLIAIAVQKIKFKKVSATERNQHGVSLVLHEGFGGNIKCHVALHC